MKTEDKLPEPMIAAKEFQRQPGRYQRLAQAHPVTITAHGEPSLVMMSVQEYRRLKRRDRQVQVVDELTAEAGRGTVGSTAPEHAHR